MSLKASVMRGLARVALTSAPASLIGRRRRGGVDVDLDPQLAAVLELQRMLGLGKLQEHEPAKARRMAEGLSVLDLAFEPMARVIDIDTGVPIRIFEPADANDHWIVYFHGGGGVIGSIDSSEPVTRYLAARTRCRVASVEYRLGPEHKHPAAIEDAVIAYQAIRARARGRVVVAGDSFGGFLAAHVQRVATPKPDLQVLIYPLTDSTMSMPSIDRHAEGYLLTKPMIEWFRNHYYNASDDRRAASPMFWDQRGNVPAIILTAGYDPLVDEGDRHAELLKAAGCRVTHRRYPSLVHGFLSLAGGVTAARDAIDELCRDIVTGLQ